MPKAKKKPTPVVEDQTTSPEPATEQITASPSALIAGISDVEEPTTQPDSSTSDGGSSDGQDGENGAVSASVSAPEPDELTEEQSVPELKVGGLTDTTAGNEVDTGFKIPTPVVQSEATKTANDRPMPGVIMPQKTVPELEDEIDSGEFRDIPSFVKKHWEAKDATVQNMAAVLRMETVEIYTILKEDLGVKLPQGA